LPRRPTLRINCFANAAEELSERDRQTERERERERERETLKLINGSSNIDPKIHLGNENAARF